MISENNFFEFRGTNGISIANSQPRHCHYQVYKPLMPGWNLVNAWKKGEIDEKKYTEIYTKEILEKLDKEQVKKDLEGKTILCWEKTGFCHRHIVMEWLGKYEWTEKDQYELEDRLASYEE